MNAPPGGRGASRGARRLARWLLAGCLAALPSAGARAENPQPMPGEPSSGAVEPAAGATAAPIEPTLEATREAVRTSTEWLVRSVDRWFGDLRIEPGGGVQDGELSLTLLKRESEKLHHRLSFDARLHLPNLERIGYAFVGRGNDRDTVVDRPEALSERLHLRSEASSQQSLFGGVGLTLRDLFDFRLGVRGRLRVYAQARYRETWRYGDNVVAFSQTFFWTVRDQVGSTSALSLEHTFGPLLTLRWLGSGTITRREEKFEWFQLIGAYHTFGTDRWLALELLADGVFHAPVDVPDYGVRLRWQQPVLRPWLIGELIVGHFWPRPDPAALRGAAWALGATATMRF